MSGVYNRKDHFYQEAKESGYRSRAAYKLKELNSKHKFLVSGARVVDLGCFPGGWLQVASEVVGQEGVVVGIDLVELASVTPGERWGKARVEILMGDIESADAFQQLTEVVGERVDVVLSDMSPKLSGVRFRDVAACVNLVECAAAFARKALKPGGSFVAKVFPGAEADEIYFSLRKEFCTMHRVKLKATRSTSTEIYLVGLGFTSE